MAGHEQQAHHFKRIALPSGKEIEVLYFDEPQTDRPQRQLQPSRGGSSTAEQPEAPQKRDAALQPATPAFDLHVCDDCEGELIYPADWEEAGHHAWRVTLVCPNCGSERRDVFPDDAVEALDEALDRGSDALARDYKSLMRANMAGEVARFVAALDADAIQPVDF